MWFGTANHKVFNNAGKRHNGCRLVTCVVQLFAGTEANSGVRKAPAAKELGNGQRTTAQTVNNVVAVNLRQSVMHLTAQTVVQWAEILLAPVVLTAVNQLSGEI